MILITPHIDLQKKVLRIEIPLTEKGKGMAVVETPLEPTEDQRQSMELIEGITIWKSTVDGWAVSPDADKALSEFFGRPVRLVRKGPRERQSGPDDRRKQPTLNFQDFYPLLVANEASIQHVRQTLVNSVYPSMSTSANSALNEAKAVEIANDHARSSAKRSQSQNREAARSAWTQILIASTAVAIGSTIASGNHAFLRFSAHIAISFVLLAAAMVVVTHYSSSSPATPHAAAPAAEAPSIPVPEAVDREYWSPEHLETLPIIRFRPNIVLGNVRGSQTPPLIPWEEDGFTELEIFDKDDATIRSQGSRAVPFGKNARTKGKVAIACMARCARCLVTTIDPETGNRDPHLPYKVLQGYRMAEPAARKIGKPCFGVLSAIQDRDARGQSEGVLKVGDVVRVTHTVDPEQRVATPA